jgi:hypothetical protein
VVVVAVADGAEVVGAVFLTASVEVASAAGAVDSAGDFATQRTRSPQHAEETGIMRVSCDLH